MVVRIIAGILALLGVLGVLAGGALVMDDATSATALMEEVGGIMSADDRAEAEEIIAKQQTTAYAMFGAAVLGIAGAVLAFMGMGTIAGPLLLLGGFVPFLARMEGFVFVFSGGLILAGIVAFFARKKKPAVSDEPVAAPQPSA